MAHRLIFVSCGQATVEEKQLGRAIQESINSHPGFKAYFADSVQSLAALADHIFDALRRCSGAIILFHNRGDGGGSSMWINQELAILAFRQYLESTEIPILVFKEPSVRLEGAMTAFIVNAKPLASDAAILAEISQWLAIDALKGRFENQTIFDEKWAPLGPDDHLILRALSDEGGQAVKEASIRRRLVEVYGIEREKASNMVRLRRGVLSEANLIQLRHNIYDGDELSIHPAWRWNIQRRLTENVRGSE
jgi:hypothetical protein